MSAPLDGAALDTIFRTARSYNGYTDAPVTDADIRAIYDLFKMGPTATNQQPGRFMWCVSQDAKDRLAAHASGSNAPKIRDAPTTVIIGMDREFHEHLPQLFPHTDARPWFADPAERKISALRNSSLQGAYFIIAARALGFDTGPMSGFNNAAVDAEFFGDTPHVTSNFIATLGVGDPASIFGRLPRPEFEQFNTIA